MLDLCLNRNLGDNIRPVNGVFQGLRLLPREYLTEVSICSKYVLPICCDCHCGIVVRFRRLRNPAQWQSGLRCPTCGRQGTACRFLVKFGAAGSILAACDYAPLQTRRRADAQTRRRADAQTRRRADAQTRRRADAQTLPDELFVAKALKTQFTAVLILR